MIYTIQNGVLTQGEGPGEQVGLFALKDDFVDAVPTQRPASTEDRPREIGPDTDILDFLLFF